MRENPFFTHKSFVRISIVAKEELGGAARWVCYTTSTYAITLSISSWGQVLGTCRAAKQKKSNFSLFEQAKKTSILQVTKTY